MPSPVKNNFKDNPERARKSGLMKRGKTFDRRMREWMESELKPGVTIEDAMRKALMSQSVRGNVAAIRESFDRAFGKARERIDVKAEISPIAKAILEMRRDAEGDDGK